MTTDDYELEQLKVKAVYYAGRLGTSIYRPAINAIGLNPV